MKRVVAIRLIGDEEAVRAAIELLDVVLGERIQIGAAYKGRKEGRDGYLAYSTLAVHSDIALGSAGQKGGSRG